MYEDYNNNQNQENTETNVNTQQQAPQQNQGEYRYTYRNDDSARWQSDTAKYNSAPESAPQPPKKKRHLWWIPVSAALVVVLAGIVVGSVIGIKALSSSASQVISNISNGQAVQISSDDEEETTSGLIINQTENVKQDTSASTSGIVLTDVSDVVSNVMPSVVSITSRSIVTSGGYNWGFWFGNQNSGQQTQEEVESGVGSGTIVGQNDEELLILTSYHVVEDCSSLYVTFCDDSAVDGYVKDASEEDDIAIVALRLSDISSDTLGKISIAALSNEDIEIGDGVIVIGNALGYGQSVVTGIVSATNRQITVENRSINVIQTDAAINSGNSGGCMLNSNGEIIGISEAKISSSTVEGMCYAISIQHYYDTIMSMLSEAPAEQETESSADNGSNNNNNSSSQGAYLGIYGYDITSDLAASYGLDEGVYVLSTVSGSGAEAAGLSQGDIIVGFEGKTISSMSELQSALANYNAGDKITLTVLKYTSNGYTETNVEVTLTASIG